ncbi:MAG: tetratricopeptide repeat protein [Cytophagia bacterium]|nr:MAG: tetratricopeptide repeat protein [Cytophagales bacterium]TAG07186.1 MAG: tetratricopeptide repeat protein [Cytophagia bacterium]TAG44411.1 MAG: tetratricopeptide repeat protein [Cytophagia bacterium]TAH29469.1 MAG: tetratricopeptide repeat protein [Cytophagales bacterium]
MKTQKRLVLSLVFVGSAFLATSCKNPLAEMVKLAKDQEITVDPNPLELHGNKVDFKVSAKLPVKMMKKGTKYTLEFVYEPGDIENKQDMQPYSSDAQKAGAISFDGDKYFNQKEDPKTSANGSFAYQDKFEVGGLFLKGIASKGEGDKAKTKEFGPVRLKVKDGRFVKGVVTTCRLVKSPVDGLNPTQGESPFAYSDHNYSAPADEMQEIGVNFEKGSVNITPNTGNNKMTMELIATLFKDTKMPAFNATGTSSHSPEGTETVNAGLAEGRAKALQMAFGEMLKKFKYTKDEVAGYKFDFSKKVMGETLPEFGGLVDGSGLSAEQKAEAKSIMNGDGDFVEKERKLQSKPYYNELMNTVYPQMRYAKVAIKKPGAAKSAAEMSALTKMIAEGKKSGTDLTEAEYLFAAANTPDLDEKVMILTLAQKSYDTWKVNNNLGAALLDVVLFKNDKSKVSPAIAALESSMSKRETGQAAYNLAMAHSMNGNKDKMEEYLQKASNLGNDGNAYVGKLINGAKGYLAIKAAGARDDGKYKEAEDVLGSSANTNPNLFNQGLAQLLQGVNYDAAIASFTSAEQKNAKDAITKYALAIAYARKGNESMMSQKLKEACGLESNLKAKAIKDVEFDKYKGGNSFKDAIR